MPCPAALRFHQRPILQKRAMLLFRSQELITKVSQWGSGCSPPPTLSPRGFLLTGRAVRLTWRPPSSRPRGQPRRPAEARQPGSMAAQGEAALSGLCMWYTSLSSSSGTCSTARPAQLRRRPSCGGRQRHLVPPATPGLTSQ